MGNKIQLAKRGTRLNLTKGRDIPLTKIDVHLGWDTNKYDGVPVDLDVTAFMLMKDGSSGQYIATDADDVVFYNNKADRAESVIHSGDNRTGADSNDALNSSMGEAIDESISVEFSKVPTLCEKIAFVVTIHEAEKRQQNFGMVDNAFSEVWDQDGNPLVRFELTEKHSTQTALAVCEIYRDGKEWKYAAVGQGFDGGLAEFAVMYGLEV